MIYTFYSFKGGVGRSMALANVAELLCQQDKDVLVIDFDLEAPGLERFFAPGNEADGIVSRRGVIDLLLSFKNARSSSPPSVISASGKSEDESDFRELPFPVEPLKQFIQPLPTNPHRKGSLSIISAGRRLRDEHAEYAERVRNFSWDDFYNNYDGKRFFEWFRRETQAAVGPNGVVLIDSRTGISEVSGVCTHFLADIVVLCLAPNDQNVHGTKVMAKSLSNPDFIKNGRNERPLPLLFLPCRVDTSEIAEYDAFAEQFGRLFDTFTQSPGLKAIFSQPEKPAFDNLRVPYVPAYAYKERVASRDPHSAVARSLMEPFQNLCRALQYYDEKSVALPQGTLRIESRLYMKRPCDEEVLRIIAQQGKGETLSIIGPRQSGKSSLLVRLAQNAQQAGKRVARVDFQSFDSGCFSDSKSESFFYAFCHTISEALNLEEELDLHWRRPLGNVQRSTGFFKRIILPMEEEPLVLILDEVERILEAPSSVAGDSAYALRNDFFGMLRAWSNMRSEDPAWNKMDLVIATTVHPSQFMTNLSQSPFNVSRNIEMTDFTANEVAQLNQQYGSPLDDQKTTQLMYLLNGHPFLVHMVLHFAVANLATNASALSFLWSDTPYESEVFGEHLRELWTPISTSPELQKCLMDILSNGTYSPQHEKECQRLHSMGIVHRSSGKLSSRCPLYSDYFSHQLAAL